MPVVFVASTSSPVNAGAVTVAKPAGAAADGEPATYTFGGDAAANNRVTIQRFRGVDAASPVLTAPAWAGNVNTSVTAHTTPSIAWASGSMLACGWFVRQADGVWSSMTSGLTQAGRVAATGNFEHMTAYQAFTSGTTTGAKTATRSVASRWIGGAMALRTSSGTGVELLVAWHSIGSNGASSAMSAPAGWTQVGSVDNLSGFSLAHVRVYYKFVTAAPPPVTNPTAPKLSTLTDRFPTWTPAKWPTLDAARHDPKRGALEVDVTMPGGVTKYAYGRSTETYSFWAATTFSFRVVRAPEGGTANAQAWVKKPNLGDGSDLGRIGFEVRVTVDGNGDPITYLDFVGQGPGYAPLGTTTSVTYDEHVHRWWMLEVSSAGHLVWYTSVDGVAWTVRRSLAVGDFPAWLTSLLLRNDLAASFEGFRTAGTSSGFVYAFVVDDVNLPPAPEPTWTVAMTGGATTFVADYSQADNEAAGYTSDSWQRQNAAGQMNDPTVPYPVPIVPAPFGRSGRAMMLRVPDTYRRYEVVPPTGYADGEYVFIGFSMLIEPDTDLDASVGSQYQIVWQSHHADDSGSPPLGLEVRWGGLRLAGGYGRPDPVTGAPAGDLFQYDTEVMPNVPTLTWLDIVLGIGVWSKVTKVGTKSQNYGSGRVDAWVNGTRYLDGFVPRAATNYLGAGDVAYPKHGIYHANENRGATVWFADYREGTSYAAVAPSATVTAYGDVIAEP